MNYDIIGDIHGHADKLEQLLERLGYELVDGHYQPGPRTSGRGQNRVIFVGDFIDRGPDNRRVIEIARRMVEDGHALAVMGNHEFNAICYHSVHPETGKPLRPHTPKNQRQHQSFLDEFPLGAKETLEVIDWFKTLPLFLEPNSDNGERIRVVHACWDLRCVDYLRQRVSNPALIDEALLVESCEQGTLAFEAIETVLKGPEIRLPEGASFFDKDGNERHNVRYQWWAGGRTYRDAALVPGDQRDGIPDLPLPRRFREPAYSADEPPVFFGHYWMNGNTRAQRHNVACLDYSAGKGGPLVAYQWRDDNGDHPDSRHLRDDQFVSSDDPWNAPPRK